MSFLDRLKEKAAEKKAMVAQVSEEKDTMLEDTGKGEKVATLLSRLKSKQKAVDKVEQSVSKENEAERLQKIAEGVVENVIKNTKENAEEETIRDEVEMKEETVQEEVKAKEEAAEEEKPKKRRGRKTKTEKAEEEKKTSAGEISEIHSAKFEQNYDVLGQKFNYDEMAGIVLDFFEDDDWKETEKELSKKLSDIRIEPDMNPGTLKYALAALNNLYDEASIIYDDQKKLLDSLTDKDFGAAVSYQALHAVGNNPDERKRNGIIALTQAKVGDKTVNYIAIIAAIKIRYAFLSHLIKRIQYKSNLCITMSGAIKMEQNLVTMSA